MKLVLVLAVATALMSSARGQDCETTVSASAIDITTEVGQFYGGRDQCASAEVTPPCRVSIWIYQESNEILGLQRSDPFLDDTCGGEVPSDTLVVDGII